MSDTAPAQGICLVKPHRAQKGSRSGISGWGCLTGVVLLVMASLCGPAAAADNGVVLQATPSTTQPETAPGGTAVLRGTPPANPNVGQAVPGGGPGSGSTNNRAA